MRYSQPLGANTSATCSMPHSENEHAVSTVLGLAYLVIKAPRGSLTT